MIGDRFVFLTLLTCCCHDNNSAQLYEQFLQVDWLDRTLILLGLAVCLPSASVSSVFVAQPWSLSTIMLLWHSFLIIIIIIYTVSQKNWTLFHLSITLVNTVQFLIILSLLQTEIICPQTCNWICHFTWARTGSFDCLSCYDTRVNKRW